MNKIFLSYLKKYTKNEFELIIIDNVSTDGSADFFEENGATVIRNSENYSYPYSQNQGIKIAKYDNFLFVNNDVIVSKDWDVNLLAILENKKLDFCSITTNDRMENQSLTRKTSNRWKAIKNPLRFLFGQGESNLRLMHKLMYGNWEKYTQKRFKQFGGDYIEGISGSSVVYTKRGLEKLGNWDERLQSADFDAFLRCKERSLKNGDINPPVVLSGIYFHHFQRLTMKASYPPFADAKNIISVEDKWTKGYANELLKGSDLEL